MEIDVRSLRFCIARPGPGMGTERRWLRAARVHEPSATTLHFRDFNNVGLRPLKGQSDGTTLYIEVN